MIASSNFATVTFFTVFKTYRHRVNVALGHVYTVPIPFLNGTKLLRLKRILCDPEQDFSSDRIFIHLAIFKVCYLQ